MIGITLLAWWMASDGILSRLDGLILVGGLVIYITFSIIQSRRETNAEVKQEYEQEYAPKEKRAPRNIAINIGQILIGLVLLTFGSDWLVDGAVRLANFFGVSEMVIGLTIVAVGTSLPELATSIVAAMRNERDIAVGNVVGSNIFNIMSVLGITSLIAPNGIPIPASALAFDIPVMVAVTIICLPVFFSGSLTIERWEGFMFLGLYAVYLTVMLSDAIGGTNYQDEALVGIVLLTVLVLAAAIFYEWLHRRKNSETNGT
ncbi:MAG: calcium/sodium antiporter, partial [Anaerolineales bacterium]